LSIEDLKQTNLHLDQFAHAASHDLQEPLRKILTFSMRLQNNHKDELSTEVISYLHKIEAASNRMTALIKDLLNYSRLFHHENSFSKTDLNDTLNNNLIDFELLIEEKKAEIVIAKLPTLEAIPFQMSQLFHNLISNSLKFSKEGVPPVISITYREFPEKEIEKYAKLKIAISYVEIIFRDNGIGFEQKYADQIFTIFQRIHNKESYSGTGIGLALCKKIIENHQGEIFVWSKENEGTVFHIILPLKNPH
jgi:two-component system CheB/CheR fusion protein